MLKWCPGAESNHRHEDFQSTALPLSYPGTGERARRSGSGFLGEGHATVQWVFATFQWGFPGPSFCASSIASVTSSASSKRLDGMA